MKKTMLMMAALLSLCVAMAMAQVGDLERTIPDEAPLWQTRISSADEAEPTFWHFMGVSQPASTERRARAIALEDGMQKWAAFCDAQVKHVVTEARDDEYDPETERIIDRTLGSSRYARITSTSAKGLKEQDSFIEIYKDAQGRRGYLAYLLIGVAKPQAASVLDSVGTDVAAEIKKELKGLPPRVQDELNALVAELENNLGSNPRVDWSELSK